MAIPWTRTGRGQRAGLAHASLIPSPHLALTFHHSGTQPTDGAADSAGERGGEHPGEHPGEHSIDGDDFDAFFQRHQQAVFGYLWRLTGEEQAAYDLSQETFLRAWQHFDTMRDYDRPGAWLIRVATNLALKHLRHRGVVGRVTAALGLGDTDAPAPGDHAAQVAEGDLVRGVLLALAPRPRAVLVLHDVYGLSSLEIADTLGMTHAAVKMMLCRAREQFRVRYIRQEAP